MLVNIGPTPNGDVPPEQENRLRELALWLVVNSEAIYGTRLWRIPREGTSGLPAGVTRTQSTPSRPIPFGLGRAEDYYTRVCTGERGESGHCARPE
jgi:alpha-L-fucosidase